MGVWHGGHFTPTSPQVVPQRDAATLMRIIHAHVANGTTGADPVKFKGGEGGGGGGVHTE